MTYRDPEGRRHREQGEGHLQLVRDADQLALSVGKLGETYVYLGSNASEYWWLDLTEQHRAWVGRHDRVSGPGQAGVPVHPLDLMDVLGVRPLPAGAGQSASVGWSADGRLLGVTLPARWGQRRTWLDPDTFEPVRVELLDRSGAAALTARLWDYKAVAAPPGMVSGVAGPRIATSIDLEVPATETRIELRLFDPANRRGYPKAAAFDLAALLNAYAIPPGSVTRLDGPTP